MDQKAKEMLEKCEIRDGRFILVTIEQNGNIDFATNCGTHDIALAHMFIGKIGHDQFTRGHINSSLRVIRSDEDVNR